MMFFIVAAGAMSDAEKSKFERIYDLYATFVYRVSLKELGDPDLAKDCAQISYERIIRYLDRIDEVDSPQAKSYIYKLVRSTALNLRKRERKYVTKQDDELFYMIDEGNHGDDEFVNVEIEEAIRFAEENLSEEDRILLSCRYDGQTSYEEASRLIGISEAACRKRMERIRRRLADAFGVKHGKERR